MPGYDGTGPMGLGPMTGRGLGYCVLKLDNDDSSAVSGFTGSQGQLISKTKYNKRKEAVMPAGDGTGPAGMGPMTGRAAGYCAGYPVPGYANPIPVRGLGFGRGRGFGFGRGLGLGFRGGRGSFGGFRTGWGGYWGAPYAAPAYPHSAVAPYAMTYGAGPTREQEADMLKGQAEYFEDALEDIKKRIAELEAKSEEKE